MTSPFDRIDSAFAVLFNEEIILTSNQGRQTLYVSIFQSITDDTLNEDTIDTYRETIDIVVKPEDWISIDKIARGSTIYRTINQKKYKVVSVKNDFIMGFVITAREF